MLGVTCRVRERKANNRETKGQTQYRFQVKTNSRHQQVGDRVDKLRQRPNTSGASLQVEDCRVAAKVGQDELNGVTIHDPNKPLSKDVVSDLIYRSCL